MKNVVLVPFLFVICLLAGCDSDTLIAPDSELASAELQSAVDAAKISTKSTVDIFNAVNGELTGKSTLNRNGNGITINFKTTGLMPGHAYTLWWVVWNKPENCATPGACVESDFANVGIYLPLFTHPEQIPGQNLLFSFKE